MIADKTEVESRKLLKILADNLVIQKAKEIKVLETAIDAVIDVKAMQFYSSRIEGMLDFLNEKIWDIKNPE